MSDSFGPWSTALNNQAMAPLSAFWKTRLALLPLTSKTSLIWRRRTVCYLAALGLALGSVPTLNVARGTAPLAEDSPAAESESAEQSPNQQELAGRIFVRAMIYGSEGPRGIYIIRVNPQTKKWAVLLKDEAFSPRVSPDSSTLAFVRNGELWNCDTQRGDSPGRISETSGEAVWSPDSREIIATDAKRDPASQELSFQTWRFHADGSNRRSLAIPRGHLVRDWSPDGQWLLTDFWVVRDKRAENQIHRMRPDGTDARQLLSGGHSPHFSPDGRWIVFAQPWKGNIKRVDLEGKNERTLFQGGGADHASGPCWSPDGRSVVFVRTNQELGENGTPVVFADPLRSNPRMVVVDLATGEHRELELPEQDGLRAWPTEELDWR